MSFKQLLAAKIAAKGTSLCLGMDPHRQGHVPPFLSRLAITRGWPKAIATWGSAILEASQNYVPAVKFQTAFFEAMGWQGMRVLEQLLSLASQLGYVTILDAKRGDIASTMTAYGEMAFDELAADALTVQPYMGFDVIAALQPWLQAGKGAYLVWLTSNVSGSHLQGMAMANGGPFTQAVFDHFTSETAALGLTEALGLVVGASRLDELSPDLGKRIQGYPLLLPGVGEQGARSDSPTLAPLLAPPTHHLVPMSRSLTGIGVKEPSELSQASSWEHYLDLFEQLLRLQARF